MLVRGNRDVFIEGVNSGLTTHQQWGHTKSRPRFKVLAGRLEKRGIDLANPKSWDPWIGSLACYILHWCCSCVFMEKYEKLFRIISVIPSYLEHWYCFACLIGGHHHHWGLVTPQTGTTILRPLLPAQGILAVNFLVYWIEEIHWTCAAFGIAWHLDLAILNQWTATPRCFITCPVLKSWHHLKCSEWRAEIHVCIFIFIHLFINLLI